MLAAARWSRMLSLPELSVHIAEHSLEIFHQTNFLLSVLQYPTEWNSIVIRIPLHQEKLLISFIVSTFFKSFNTYALQNTTNLFFMIFIKKWKLETAFLLEVLLSLTMDVLKQFLFYASSATESSKLASSFFLKK